MKNKFKVLSSILILLIFVTSNCFAQFKTVKIGKQTWAAENLNVKIYRNGDKIPQVKDANEWSKLTTGAWCYYQNKTEYGFIYGIMYNWYAVNDPRGLAPKGWHIPSDAEWLELINSLGGINEAGIKMKTKTGWSDDGNGTNESGFSALPSGARNNSGEFNDLGRDGYWWSSSENTNETAWTRGLNYGYGEVFRGNANKRNGFAVRCVQD
jgi:uncharacterized protein (TIGR02145 family)